MRLIRVLSALGVFICFVLWVSSALAARNASGTYAKLYTFVAGQVINSTNMNSQFSDIETEITDSLDRSGKGGMLAALRGVSGTVTAPAYSWTADTGTGIYAIASSDIGFSINQSKVGEWTANGYRSGNGAVATPSLSFFNDTGSGLYRIGSNNIGFAINGVKVQEWDANTTTTKIGSKLALWGSTPTLGFNLYNDGSNRYMTTNLAGALTLDLTNGFIFYTAPSGSADAVATITERLRVNSTGLTTTGTLTQGSSGQLTSDASGNLTTTGILTAAEFLCSTYGASASRCGAVSANGSGDATVTIAASMHACICSDATVTTPAATGCNLSGTTLTVKTTALHAINYFCF